jgi:hypothetical protein
VVDANGFRLAYIYAREEEMLRADHLSPADRAVAGGVAEGLGGVSDC